MKLGSGTEIVFRWPIYLVLSPKSIEVDVFKIDSRSPQYSKALASLSAGQEARSLEDRQWPQ